MEFASLVNSFDFQNEVGKDLVAGVVIHFKKGKSVKKWDNSAGIFPFQNIFFFKSVISLLPYLAKGLNKTFPNIILEEA